MQRKIVLGFFSVVDQDVWGQQPEADLCRGVYPSASSCLTVGLT